MANLTKRLANGPIDGPGSSVSSQGLPDRTGDRLNQATAELHAELLANSKPLNGAWPDPRQSGLPSRPGNNRPAINRVSQSGTIRLSDLAARKR
ncbi:MAG: hypothetical protein LBJ61_07665 [Deltaproteobacteria bacterium]|nr:hypothetical protein [Deltaproteobacteria bacterium]